MVSKKTSDMAANTFVVPQQGTVTEVVINLGDGGCWTWVGKKSFRAGERFTIPSPIGMGASSWSMVFDPPESMPKDLTQSRRTSKWRRAYLKRCQRYLTWFRSKPRPNLDAVTNCTYSGKGEEQHV